MKTTALLRSFLLLAGSSLLVGSAAAATRVWDGSEDGLWSTAGNWDVAPAATGDSLTFTGPGNKTNSNDAGVTNIGTLTLSNGGWDIGLGTLTINGIAATGSSDLSGTLTMTGQASHTITLNGTNSTLAMGTLILGRVNNTTTLNVNGTGNTLALGGLQLGNGGSGNNSRTINNSANVTITGSVTQNGTVPSFTKQGAGILTLMGASSYTAPTIVTGGTLLVNNTTGSGTGSNAVTVNGGTLGGTGSITGNVTINSTGVLAPGASIESLSTGAVTFTTGSTYSYELNTTAVTGDLLDANGNLSLDGLVTLNLSDLGSNEQVAQGTKFTLFSYDGTWSGGTFDGYADDSTFSMFNNEWLINYDDNPTGSVNGGSFANAVTLTVVPEPRSALLGALGLLALLRRRR